MPEYSPKCLAQLTLKESLKRRLIFVVGEITRETAERVCASVVFLNTLSDTEPITLYLDSNGGTIFDGLDIAEAILTSKAPVCGIVLRSVASVAAIVFECCTVRRMGARAALRFHDIEQRIRLYELQDEKRRTEIIERGLADWKRLVDIVSARTKTSFKATEAFFNVGKGGRTFRAEQALEAGLIDEVIPSTRERRG